MTFDYLEPIRLVSAALGFVGRWTAWALIWGYRLLLRPLFPATCRFEPSCSEYGLIAVRRFGALRGGWLTLRRLLRCNPWGPWGHDPVPDCTSHSHSIRIGYRREHP